MTCKTSELVAPTFSTPHRLIKSGQVQELVAEGGRGSTKSSYLSIELLLTLQRHPECHAVVLRKAQNRLRTSVYNQIRWAIGMLGMSAYFDYTVSPMEMTYRKTGQKILFFGLDDPGKLKSLKVPFGYVGVLWIEELDQFSGPEEVRNAEQSLFRGGAYSLALKSFNPPAAARNWANRYALEMRDGKLVHHSTYLDVPQDWLGPRFIADAEHLKISNPTAYRHEYLGEVVGNGTAVFDNIKTEAISNEQINSFDRVLCGLDWGYYPDPLAFNRVQLNAAQRVLYIFDEYRAYRTGNSEAAEALKKKGIKGDDSITADSAEPKSIADMRKYGLDCRGAEKGPGSVTYSMKWLQSLAAIVIDPERCPHTLREFGEYEYERDRDGEIMQGYPDTDNHHIDAVRYATERIWRRRGQ